MFYTSSGEKLVDPVSKKRKRGVGLILRMVDVIFILLFGFIVISEVEQKSVIKLAKSKTTLPDIPDKEIVVFIGVQTNGSYLIEKESQLIDNLQDLERYIDLKHQFFMDRNTLMRIRIRANFDTAVKHAFPIIGACRKRGIPVGIDVIKTAGGGKT